MLRKYYKPAMPDNQINYREANSEDTTALSSIDSSFATNTIYTPTPAPSGSLGFTLTETPISPPLTKHFPDESSDLDSNPDTNTSYNYTLLAEPLPTTSNSTSTSKPKPIGFIATTYHPWNKRLQITTIEISPTHRGQGIGGKLIDLAERHAREEARLDVRYIWLEVSNVNAPAIKSYLRMGFEICGVDVSLYEGTEAKGEVGIFMWRSAGELLTGM